MTDAELAELDREILDAFGVRITFEFAANGIASSDPDRLALRIFEAFEHLPFGCGEGGHSEEDCPFDGMGVRGHTLEIHCTPDRFASAVAMIASACELANRETS